MKQREVRRHSSFRFYFINILLFLIIAVIAAVMGAIFLCEVKTIEVKGSHIYYNSEIEEQIFTDEHDNNAVYAFLRSRFTPHKSIPFVSSYTVSMTGRNTLLVTVKEKELYGMVLGTKEHYVYYDTEGLVQENSKRYVPDVFFVDGLVAKEAKKGETLPVGSSNVKTILTLQKELAEAELDVAQVTFSEEGTITFQTGQILVNLGTRASLAEKIRRLPYILPQLTDQSGTLHLEEWSEDNTDIVFEKS